MTGLEEERRIVEAAETMPASAAGRKRVLVTAGDLLPSDEMLYRRAGATVIRGDDGSLMVVCPHPGAMDREVRRYTDVLAPLIAAEAARRVAATLEIHAAVKKLNAQAKGPIDRWGERG